MNTLLSEKQRYLIMTAFHILVDELKIPAPNAKSIIFQELNKELQNKNITLEEMKNVSRVERHNFIRKVANNIEERLIQDFDLKKVVLEPKIAKFMQLKNMQSQQTQGRI